MKILLCEACGGTLERLEDNVYICTYCGTKQLVGDDNRPAKPKDNTHTPYDKYNAACFARSQAKTAKEYLCAARLFEEIKWYKNSAKLMQDCEDRANDLTKDEIYSRAVELMSEGTPHFLCQAAELFGRIPEWRDSEKLRADCLSKVSQLDEQINRRNQIVKKRHEKERRRQTAKIIIIASLILIAYLALVFIFD